MTILPSCIVVKLYYQTAESQRDSFQIIAVEAAQGHKREMIP